MLKSIHLYILTFALAASSITALAGPLDFTDLGTSTVDNTTGLEWLDLTETAGRSYDDIIWNLTFGDEFKSWRYSTKNDFGVLIANWFDTEYSGGLLYIQQPDAVELFIHTFGDTTDYWADTLNAGLDVVDGAAGRSSGILSDIYNSSGYMSVALVHDGEYLNRINGQLYTDEIDAVTDSHYLEQRDTDLRFGSWLIRNYTPVPEPTTIALLALGLAGVGWSRRKKTKR